jgi:hypothetical protein
VHALSRIERCYFSGNPGGGVCVCTVACCFVGWGAPDWRPDATAGRVLGRDEMILVPCAFVLLSGLGGARHWRFVRGGRRDQGCCCAMSLRCRSDAVEASASRFLGRSWCNVDVTRRSWMRAVDSPVRWVRRSPMRSTPSVALTASQGVRTRFTGSLAIVTGTTVFTSLLIHTAVVCGRGCGCVGQACSCCGLQRLLIVLAPAPWDGAAPVETSLDRR